MNFSKPLTLLALITSLLTSNGLFSQHTDWCGTDPYNEELSNDPHARQFADGVIQQLRKDTKHYLNNPENFRDEEVYIIPLVVHVIHDNGIGNISYEQILDGVRILNEDLRRMNADTTGTRDVFKPHAVDSRIEFRLAKIDPNGNCTNGVVRIDDPFFAYNGNNQAKQLSVWPPNRYFNYWLSNHLPTSGEGLLLGYAQFPFWGVNNNYGVMQRNDRFGSIGTASNSDGRTTSHEVGHCLGLYHTFQSGCGGDCSDSGDEVCDTPPVSESSWGCSWGDNTCSNDMQGPSPYTEDVNDQIENYMSYNGCQNMFSDGQKFRMRWVLENIGALQNLVSESNLIATGVLQEAQLCQADFEVSRRHLCVGETVTFTDLSFDSESVTGREWTFQGGFPQTSTEQNVEVTYTEPGVYSVELTVTDGSNSASKVVQEYIIVEETHETPLFEGFEDYTFSIPEEEWRIRASQSNLTWELTSMASFEGIKSLMIRNHSKPSDRREELISKAFDLSDSTAMRLSFRYAYRKRQPSNEDVLRVFFSNDCGETWIARSNLTANGNLVTSEMNLDEFYPQQDDEWKLFEFDVDEYFMTENFRFKVRFTSGGGGNVFIDNINLLNPNTVSTKDRLAPDNLIKIYPNPTREMFFIDFNVEENATIAYTLIDISGRTLINRSLGIVNNRSFTEEVDVSKLPKGIYLLQTSVNYHRSVKKVVVR
jgi:PKD repeat protein